MENKHKRNNKFKLDREYIMKKSGYLFILLFLLSNAYSSLAFVETSLDKNTLDLISNTVFEVVVPKPTKDSLSYEKPLPMDLIPYTIRNDKYYSVGTAFAISPSQFVTASHVMNLGFKSQFEGFFLRDKDGKVYGIDKILKYSSRRDFVVFSIKDKNIQEYLQVNKKPQINEKVYAVGNALGEGIVRRDGLYTSNTPEEEEGEWKWMRFSAAASPGNSGGPLLDSEGNVIGVILGKSPNENLNKALPIEEVINAKSNVATVYHKMKYFLDNMDMTKTQVLNKDLPLPLSCQELNSELIKIIDQFSSKLLEDLLLENKDTIFPIGKGSDFLLNSTYNAVFPHLIMKGEDGRWDAFRPKEIKNAELGENGHLSYGSLQNSTFLYIIKPDSVSLERFYNDSKLFMDLILKGINISRQIESEKIKIISMGKADEANIYTDSYSRKWMVRTWLVEYSDSKVVTFSLPVPGGCITMMRIGPTFQVDSGYIPDLKALANFVYISYYGSFKQWREFLSIKDLLPPVFSSIDVAYDYNNQFRYKSKRFSLSYKNAVMDISEKSDLTLLVSFFKVNGETIWDVNGISIGNDKNSSTAFSIIRKSKPPEELGDKYKSNWDDMLAQKFPYNRSAYYKDKTTVISSVYNKDLMAKKGNEKDTSVIYSVSYARDGNIEQKEMEAKLDEFMKNILINDGF